MEFDAVRQVSEEAIIEFAIKVHQRADDADAMLISCGGLRTLNITVHIESEIQRPVISSNTAGIWLAVRLAGHSGKSPGFGRLFEMDVPQNCLAVLNQLESACSIVDLTRRSTFALTDLVNSNFYSAAKCLSGNNLNSLSQL